MGQRSRNGIVPVVLVALLASLLAAAAPARPAAAQAVDPWTRHVRPSPDPVPGQYIVTLRDGSGTSVDTTAHALTRRHGGEVLAVYDAALQGYAVATTPEAAEELANDPAVAAVEEDGYVEALTTQTPAPSWGLDRIDETALPLDNAYTFTTGAPNVHAYVIDSGINMALPDFGGRVTLGIDAVGGVTPPGSDCAGHGTHVAGTIGGSTYGVAKGIQLVSVRVLNCSGSGSYSDVIEGVNWVTANAIKPAVANMSLGGSKSVAVDSAVAASIASGIPYAIAAGNGNTDACNTSPSGVTSAIVVGATDQNDARATFSNVGPCVDLFAPGVGITSDWHASPFTKVVSGTSMAAPHVTGVAAQYLGSHPDATAEEIASALVCNANHGTVTGAGAGSRNRLLYSGAEFVPSCVPDPPVLSATANNGVVDLSWSIPDEGSSPIDHFTIARSVTAGNETTLVPNQSPLQTTYTDTTVAVGTTYYYTVTATNGDGASDPSNEASATPATPPPPTPQPQWSGWDALGGNPTDRPAVAAWSAGRLDVFVRGTDGQLWHKWFAGGWSGWETLGGAFTDGPAVAAWSAGRLDVFVRGTDGQLWHKWFAGGWSGWETLGGAFTDGPAVAAWSAGRLDVFVRGTDGQLWHKWFAGGWSGWETLGGAFTDGPAVAAWSAGRLDVFVRGTDGQLWHKWFAGGWSGWETLGGAFTDGPAVAAWSAGRLDVFVRGTDGQLWHKWFAGGWSGWETLGGAFTDGPAVAAWSAGRLDVFVRGTDGQLWHKSFDGS